jgi:hypothetical protein
LNANALRLERVALALLRAALILPWCAHALAAGVELDPAKIPAATWGMVLGSALVGYMASSAEMLFGWAENKGWRAFGRIVQSFFASMAAGVAAYLIAVSAGLSPVICVLAVLPAAYAGENYMRKLSDSRDPALPQGKV